MANKLEGAVSMGKMMKLFTGMVVDPVLKSGGTLEDIDKAVDRVKATPGHAFSWDSTIPKFPR